MKVDTLIELLQHRLKTQPDDILYKFLEGEGEQESQLTYRALDRRARQIAASLQQLFLTGKQTLLLYPPGLEYIEAFWGCIYAGITAIPAYPPRLNRPMPRLLSIIKDAQTRVVLTTAEIASAVEKRSEHLLELPQLTWLATDTFPTDAGDEWQPPNITSDRLVFLQYTSGSTAAPNGVMLSHRNLLHNLSLIQHSFDLTPENQSVIWLPPYHDMGLIGGILEALYAGFPVTLMPPMAFLQRPLHWLETISKYRATVSGGPNFAYDLCVQKTTPEEREKLDLSSWRVAFNGAEPIRAETLLHFTEAFRPAGFRPETFYPCYGLAEATLFVTGGSVDKKPIIKPFNREALTRLRAQVTVADDTECTLLVSSGRAARDLTVVIADPNTGQKLPENQVGEIWISGLSVAQGYWLNAKATQATFAAKLSGDNSGLFLRTGDLGFWHNGELFVTGRIKDLLIIRGRNYYPQDIELTVETSHEALRLGCTAAFMTTDNRLAVAQEINPRFQREVDLEGIVRAIRQAVSETFDLQVEVVLLLRAGYIPKTSSGKIQRHACRLGYERGTLNLIGKSELGTFDRTMEDDGMDSILYELAAATDQKARRAWLVMYLQHKIARTLHLSLPDASPTRPLTKLGLDQFTGLALKNELETDLSLTISADELLDGTTIWQLASNLATKLGQDSTRV